MANKIFGLSIIAFVDNDSAHGLKEDRRGYIFIWTTMWRWRQIMYVYISWWWHLSFLREIYFPESNDGATSPRGWRGVREGDCRTWRRQNGLSPWTDETATKVRARVWGIHDSLWFGECRECKSHLNPVNVVSPPRPPPPSNAIGVTTREIPAHYWTWERL